jgi:hypothetical protein
MNRRNLFITTGVILLLSIITTTSILRGRRENQAGAVPRQDSRLAPSAVLPPSAGPTLVESVSRLPSADAIPQAEAKEIASVTFEALRIYRTGTLAEFIEFQRSQALTIPPRWQTAGAEDSWKLQTSMMRTSLFLSDQVQAAVGATGGQWRATLPRRGVTMAYTRPVEFPGDVDPLSPQVHTIEIQFPMRLTGRKGEVFDAVFGIRLAKRPSDGKWIVVGSVVHDMPLNTQLLLPPS